MSSQIKHWFFLYCVNSGPHIFRPKNAGGREDWDSYCNRFSNLKVLDIKITTKTSLINNIYENAAELIITEVKFTKKFLHAVGENCHGKKWLKIKVYIVNHTGNVHDKQSLMIIISSFSSCVPLLSQLRESALYKYNGDAVITLYCIIKNDCLGFKTTIFCIF